MRTAIHNHNSAGIRLAHFVHFAKMISPEQADRYGTLPGGTALGLISNPKES